MNSETDGERAVRVALEHLGIKYESEKEITNLKGDVKQVRRADFFLPDYDIYVEYAGGWDGKDKVSERIRYNEKKEIYRYNDIKCIWIYPRQLNYVTKVITDKIKELSIEQVKISPTDKVTQNKETDFKLIPLKWYEDMLFLAKIAAILLFVLSLIIPFFWLALLFDGIIVLILDRNHCKHCKRLFGEKHIGRNLGKIEQRVWKYRIANQYLYSDGTIKNTVYSDWYQRTERIKIYDNEKECSYCGYKWIVSDEENLDLSTRPRTLYIHTTHYKNPAKKHYRY